MNEINYAHVIADQIGQVAFRMMGTQFKLSNNDQRTLEFNVRGSSKRITRVHVTLNLNDLYDVEFYKLRRKNLKKLDPGGITLVHTERNVHVESLHDTIAEHTGLELRMPVIKQVPTTRVGMFAPKNRKP